MEHLADLDPRLMALMAKISTVSSDQGWDAIASELNELKADLLPPQAPVPAIPSPPKAHSPKAQSPKVVAYTLGADSPSFFTFSSTSSPPTLTSITISSLLKTSHALLHPLAHPYPKAAIKKLSQTSWAFCEPTQTKAIYLLNQFIATIFQDHPALVPLLTTPPPPANNNLGQLFCSDANRALIHATVQSHCAAHSIASVPLSPLVLIEPCCGHGHVISPPAFLLPFSHIVINDVDETCTTHTAGHITPHLGTEQTLHTYNTDCASEPIPIPQLLHDLPKIVVSGPPYGTSQTRSLPSDIIATLLSSLANVELAIFILPQRLHDVHLVHADFTVEYLDGVDDEFLKPVGGTPPCYKTVRQPTVIRVYRRIVPSA